MGILGYAVAVSPFFAAGVALLWLGWSAARAGAATLVVAVAGTLLWPGFDPGGILGAVGGLATAAGVLYVLLGGLLLFNVLSAGGAVESVSGFLARLEPEKGALGLLVVVGAAPFFESVTGFGVAVVISAPILLAAGFSPVRAAVLASWGQLAVPWGALGVGTVIGADLAGFSFAELSDASALLSLPLFPLYGVAAVALADGWEGVRRRGLEAVAVGLAGGIGTLLCSLYLVPELSGVLGGLLAVVAFLLPRLLPRRRARFRGLRVPIRALAPYGILLALLAAANGVPALRDLAETSPALEGPGPWLLVSAVFAAALLGLNGRALIGTVGSTARQWLPVAGAIVTFILAGRVVAEGGAAELLAGGAAGLLGGAYPAAAPLIGALGGALTGSNAGSNALFMPLQIEAAHGTGSPDRVVAALQNVAGSQSNLVSPQRVVLATTATGLIGEEARLVRAICVPVVASLAVLVAAGIVLS